MKITNISFVKYHELTDRTEHDKYIKLLKAKDILNIGEFVNLSFGFVKDMQEHFNFSGITWSDFLDEMAALSKKSVKELALMSVYEINQQFLYCKEQVIIINNIEKIKLSHEPDADEKAANIGRFSIYRSYPQFRKLSKRGVLDHDAVRILPYHLCLTELAYDADSVRFTKDLQNIKDKKNK